MDIRGYLQTSLIEWPGKISSVIFVPGCNFCCPFCHNRDLVDPSRIKGLKEISDESIFRDLKKRKKWIDGVIVTGGEPTLQPDLSRFLSRCKRMGFETMIGTNGSKSEVLKLLIAAHPRLSRPVLDRVETRSGGEAGDSQLLIDFIAMDYKTTFEDYAEVVKIKNTPFRQGFAGQANQRLKKRKETNLVKNIKKSMKLILSSGLPFEFRTTVVPGIHDKEVLIKMAGNLEELASNVKCQMSNVKWMLQNFQPKNCLDSKFEKKKPYDIKKMEGFLRAVKKIIPGAELRGFSWIF